MDPAQAARALEQLRREVEAEEDVGVGERGGEVGLLGHPHELDLRVAGLHGTQLVVADGPAHLLDTEVEDDLHARFRSRGVQPAYPTGGRTSMSRAAGGRAFSTPGRTGTPRARVTRASR